MWVKSGKSPTIITKSGPKCFKIEERRLHCNSCKFHFSLGIGPNQPSPEHDFLAALVSHQYTTTVTFRVGLADQYQPEFTSHSSPN